MSETFNPSVQTTFLPKTSGLVFGERFQARSDKGRIFLSAGGYVPGPDPGPDVPGLYCTDLIQSVISITNTGVTATVSGWNSAGNAINTADPTNTRATGQNNTAGKITFSTPLLGVTKVEAYTRFNLNGRAGLKRADGNDIQVDMTGTGTKWYTVYDGDSIDLKEYYQQVDLSGNKSSDDFWALRINGVVVGNASQDASNNVGPINPIASPDIVLTFPTDNNFDKFEVGDVVQDPDVSITDIDNTVPSITTDGGSWYGADGTGDASDGRYEPSQNWKGTSDGIAGISPNIIDYLYDGDLTTTYAQLTDAKSKVLNATISNVTSVKLTFQTSSNAMVYITDSDGDTNDTNLASFTDGNINTVDLNLPSGSTLQSIEVDADSGIGLFGITVNGKILVDSSVPGGRGQTRLCKTIVIGTVSATVAGAPYDVVSSPAISVNTGNATAATVTISGKADVTYRWSVRSGGTAQFSDPSGATTDITIPTNGLNIVQCTIQSADEVEVVTITLLASAYVPSAAFSTVLYTGNGGTQSINCGFSPALVWVKAREAVVSHALFDTIRGPKLQLRSDTTQTEISGESLISFDSDGFTVSYDSSVNDGGKPYIAWCWDAGDTTVTNNDGTIESQVRSNGSFSVVKYTGDATAGKTIGHGLTNAPSFIICKSTNQDVDWFVYAKPLSAFTYLRLSDITPGQNSGGVWGNTDPTDKVFTVGDSIGTGSADDFIAYCWAETPDVSSFGKYEGNGSTATGPVVDCGFKPAFVMVKNTTSGGNWKMVSNFDSSKSLEANNSNSQRDEGYMTFTNTGFAISGSSDATTNTNGSIYIYAAFA